MLNFDRMDVDLSIVKKERLELDDYGQNAGNILDNFISENDYSDFGQTVPIVVRKHVFFIFISVSINWHFYWISYPVWNRIKTEKM